MQMGKYEAKVTRTSHLTSMITAILISLAVGLGVGYFLGLNMPIKFNKQSIKPTDVQIQTQKSSPESKPAVQAVVQDNMPSKDQQTALVKGVLKSFYDINLNTFKELKSESLNESKTQGVSQDSVFKDKLIKAYQEILSKKQFDIMTDFVNKGSLQSDYYIDYFTSQEGSIVSAIENINYTTNTINAEAVVTNPFEYGGNYNIPSSQSFFGEFKGKGMTGKQYAKLLGLKPSKVEVIETKTITLTIENINGKWMITSMNDAIASSEIKSVTIKGKNITFTDLMKKYIK